MDEIYKKMLVLVGVGLINIPYSVGMYYGNLLSYVYSYSYSVLGSGDGDLPPIWLLGIFLIFFTLGNLIETLVQRLIGLRLATAVSIVLFTSGLTLTYFTIQKSMWATLITFAVMAGTGNGMIQAASIYYIAGWFDHKVGMASAAAGAAAGIGGNIMNLILTSFINPNDLGTDEQQGQIAYFSQAEIIDKIPGAFLVIGSVTAAFQIIGFFLLRKPANETDATRKDSKCDETSKKGSYESLKSIELKAPEDKKEEEHEGRTCANFWQTDEDVKPMDVLKQERFYIVFCAAFSIAFGQLIVATYYKLFGQLFIPSDVFLAELGSSLSIAAIFARLICGYATDKFGPKNTIIAFLVISSVFQATWYFTVMVSKWWYFVWTDFIFSFLNSQYTLFPIVVVKFFGRKYCATNLFLVNIALMSAMFISPPLMSAILNKFGWFWLFYFGGLLSLSSLIAVVLRI